ncbi:hypothetical protein [Mucilaginibacter sp.]
MTLPHEYLQQFLKEHPEIRTCNYDNAGHAAIIKNPGMIADLVSEINKI